MDCKSMTVAQIEEKLLKLEALEKAAASAKTHGRPVVICTDKRGVFFGYLTGPNKMKRLTLKNARMCVYWPPEQKGVMGLAIDGPHSKCKITKAVPSVDFVNLHAILDCTPEAANAWEKAPWA